MKSRRVRISLFLSALVVIGAVVGLAVVPSAVTAHEHDPEEQEEETGEPYTHPLLYWSEIENEFYGQAGDIDPEDREGLSDLEYQALSHDYIWVYPTDEIDEWNQDNHQRFGTPHWEVEYPDEAELNDGHTGPHTDITDNAYIQDAYVEIHSTTPSSTVHIGQSTNPFLEDRTTYNYMNPDSEVNVINDYRIHAPDETHNPPPADHSGSEDFQGDMTGNLQWSAANAHPNPGGQVQRTGDLSDLSVSSSRSHVGTHIERDIQEHGIERVWMEWNDEIVYDTNNESTPMQSGDSLTLDPTEGPVEDGFETPGIFTDSSQIEVNVEYTAEVDVSEYELYMWCDPCEDSRETHYFDIVSADNSSDCRDSTTGHSCNSLPGSSGSFYDRSQSATRTNPDPGGDRVRGTNIFYKEYAEWELDEWTEEDDVTATTESDNRQVYELTTEIRYAEMPDGNTQIEITPRDGDEGTWDSASLPDGQSVNTRFQYFSVRDDDWDVMEQTQNTLGDRDPETLRTEEGSQPLEYWWDPNIANDGDPDELGGHPMRPAELHAYPDESGLSLGQGVGSADGVIHTRAWGEMEPPNIPENVDVSLVEEEYAIPDEVVVESIGHHDLESEFNEDEKEVDGVTVYGIVPESTAEVEDVAEVDVEEPQFETELLDMDEDEGTADYEITVTDESGSPINIAELDDTVVVDGDEYNPEDGTVEFTINYEEQHDFDVHYQSDPWYEHWNAEEEEDPLFVDTEETISSQASTHDSVEFIFDMIYLVVVPFFAIFLILSFMDKVLPVSFWPPWKGYW